MKREHRHSKKARHFTGRIFFRNLSMLAALVIVPILLAVFLGTYSQRVVVEKEVALYNLRTVSLLQDSMNELFESCLQQADYLLSDNDINLFLITQKDGYTFYHNDVIYKLMKVQMQANPDLLGIYIYSNVNGKFVSNYGETSLNRFFDTEWLKDYQSYDGGNSFFYAFRDGQNSYLQPVRILSLYKILTVGGQRRGVIVYNVNFDQFIHKISQYRGEYDISLSLRTEDGNLIEPLWGENDLHPLKGTFEENGRLETDDFIVYRSPVEFSDLYLYSVLSRDALQARLMTSQTALIAVVAGVCLLVLALTILISMRIYHPFHKILEELETPAGLLKNKVAITQDEESFILESIHSMSAKNEEITEELSRRVSLLKQAQSVALQSQINPHFLHNTLDSISWATMRLTGGKNETSIMLSKLAQILRYSLDDVDTLVPLQKELNNTRIYLELQELRYRNAFQVEWEIQDDVLNCQVIKILLQPIVENAIQHGLKPMSGGGFLKISAHTDGGLLLISIFDNGGGIPAERLASIQSVLHSDMIQQQDSIGIVNVHQRIRLFYGEEYGLELSSEHGTLVTLKIPVVRAV